jgi:hypothetical protein
MVTGLLSSVVTMAGGEGRMRGAGGGIGKDFPSRRVRRDWMVVILLGGASWMPAMVAVSLVVASMFCWWLLFLGPGGHGV